ncbi:hypothetical protein SGFS_006950 [Streptomyces graminofaciens]|uniref:Uncharacterized protein n=1 Tax=Streptomyces graminofaciens TaxID=68212 RepID=A0ABN5V8H0_9ACTN|nr:hypothetical protein SGFS_006950 [Streptomyces graminofaciens]
MSSCILRLPPPIGEVVPGGEGAGMVRTQYPHHLLHQHLEGLESTLRIPCPPPIGEVVPGARRSWAGRPPCDEEAGDPGGEADEADFRNERSVAVVSPFA